MFNVGNFLFDVGILCILVFFEIRFGVFFGGGDFIFILWRILKLFKCRNINFVLFFSIIRSGFVELMYLLFVILFVERKSGCYFIWMLIRLIGFVVYLSVLVIEWLNLYFKVVMLSFVL